MLFYSIYPLAVVFAEEEESENREQWREIEVEGKTVLVTVNSRGERVITRLLSTDPADYLDPRWTPGNVIV
ncbi:YlzJ-like family protein [Capillibacterium thermochitinicola]|uniref:YlzJ-like family protein n=1 Tax=Capillibacterium thermochitinicola TaxID=2699427 RepID=A0A8J6I146_9FIRM|nr:YlzJ-like family protein [Capillibacterium thermochitinicola]MBA2132382.1 YlzJ-like family protein [Capillibacterium thermochitinicola]